MIFVHEREGNSMRTWNAVVAAALAAAMVMGCGRSARINPTAPSDEGGLRSAPQSIERDREGPNRLLWGFWSVTVSEDRTRAEIVPVRTAAMHLNVVRLLEVTACHTCLTIGNLHPSGPNELEVDVILTHPFPGLLKFTGFDVRGVFIAQTDFTFPVSGRKIAWGNSVPRMLNPDGYTSLFNPTEYPPTSPAALGYIPGKYATGGDLTSTLNPFMAYRRDAPRRMFEAGGSEARIIRLYAPSGPIHFGYAVDACWELVENVIDPLTDFPPEANCLEAYRLDVTIGAGLLSSIGSSAPIQIEVYDHQGQETISSVRIEAPDLFPGELLLDFSDVSPNGAFLFDGTLPNTLGAADGDYPLLVTATDTEADPNLGEIAAWQVSRVTVGPPKGWTRTWGGDKDDKGYGVAIDGSGNTYVTGCFRGTVDFDPGTGVDNHATNGYYDVFLSKFDSSGAFEWARTWGGSDYDYGEGVAIDGSGNVYVTGYFEGTVDFDPGSGVDNHTSNGSAGDVFLSRFDSWGAMKWAHTWGGSDWDEGLGVAVDGPGNVYVTGWFSGTVDFDPGSGVDNHTSHGHTDVFLSKLDSSGAFQWARTWGGSDDWDEGRGVGVDGSGNVYVTGFFRDTADFDPGSGVDNHTSNGDDVFLSKFDSSGAFIWARTWGGNWGYGVAVDGSDNVYVTGEFYGTVDFDPGSGVDNRTSNGVGDVFLSKFDSSGAFKWARTWGGSSHESDEGVGVAADGSDNVYVTGWFQDTVDFDPGSGVDNHTSNGEYDVFLSKFDSSGAFVWARTWGGSYWDWGHCVAVDGSGSVYVTGLFTNTVDFDPGSGVDNHTTNGGTDAFLSKFPPDGNW